MNQMKNRDFLIASVFFLGMTSIGEAQTGRVIATPFGVQPPSVTAPLSPNLGPQSSVGPSIRYGGELPRPIGVPDEFPVDPAVISDVASTTSPEFDPAVTRQIVSDLNDACRSITEPLQSSSPRQAQALQALAVLSQLQERCKELDDLIKNDSDRRVIDMAATEIIQKAKRLEEDLNAELSDGLPPEEFAVVRQLRESISSEVIRRADSLEFNLGVQPVVASRPAYAPVPLPDSPYPSDQLGLSNRYGQSDAYLPRTDLPGFELRIDIPRSRYSSSVYQSYRYDPYGYERDRFAYERDRARLDYSYRAYRPYGPMGPIPPQVVPPSFGYGFPGYGPAAIPVPVPVMPYSYRHPSIQIDIPFRSPYLGW